MNSPQLSNKKFNKKRPYGSRLIDEARMEFLLTVERLAPQVLVNLKETVFSLFPSAYRDWQQEMHEIERRKAEQDEWAAEEDQRVKENRLRRLEERIKEAETAQAREYLAEGKLKAEAYFAERQRVREGRYRPVVPDTVAFYAEWPDTLREALRRWARTYGLTKDNEPPDWVIDNAASTLLAWAMHDIKSNSPLVWSLYGEHKEEKDHGQMPEPQCFAWAAKWQCGGATIASMVKGKYEKRDNIKFGIQRVLDLVGLDRRRGRAGRPPKIG